MIHPLAAQLVAELRAERIRLGLSQATLARRLWISAETLSRWERCLSEPTLGRVLDWAAALDLYVTFSHTRGDGPA